MLRNEQGRRKHFKTSPAKWVTRTTGYVIVAEGNSAAKQLNLGGSGGMPPQKNFEIYMF